MSYIEPDYPTMTMDELRRFVQAGDLAAIAEVKKRFSTGTKDVHSQVAVHTVGYGIGTVVASQANTEPAKKRRRKRVRALAYRRHPKSES